MCVHACVCVHVCGGGQGSGWASHQVGLTPPPCTVPCSGDCTPGVPGALRRGPEQRDPEHKLSLGTGWGPFPASRSRWSERTRDTWCASCTASPGGRWPCAGLCWGPADSVPQKAGQTDETPGQKPEFPVPREQWEASHFPFRFHSKSRGKGGGGAPLGSGSQRDPFPFPSHGGGLKGGGGAGCQTMASSVTSASELKAFTPEMQIM